MTITSILLLFDLLLSSVARMNPFRGCLHWLKASQVICNTNWLTGFSVMGISIEESFRAICEIIFLVNRILLSLLVFRLALIFLICMVCLVFFTLYCFSTLVCANLVGRSLGWFVCFELGSTFIDAVPLVCTAVFDHSFVDWNNMYFQRSWLLWFNIVRQWEFPTTNFLFVI